MQDDSGECGSENAAAAAETQELYSLEEVHLLLKVLQKKTDIIFSLKRGFCRAVDKIISTDCCKDEWEY